MKILFVGRFGCSLFLSFVPFSKLLTKSTQAASLRMEEDCLCGA